MTEVLLTSGAREDLRELDGSARKLVLKALVRLRDQPDLRGQPLGSNAVGDLTGFRKMVVGNRDYRIVYRGEPSGDVTVVWDIAKRSDNEVYRLAVARLKTAADLDVDVAEGLHRMLDQTFGSAGDV